MKIAVVSSTTIPATLPDDPVFFSTYGSESYNALLVKGLVELGHTISWFAPIRSSMFRGNDNIEYYPIKDASHFGLPKGAHLQDERLEKISIRPFKTTNLLDYDFIIDMSKQNHITEDLSVYHDYHHYIQYKSGYQDWASPRMGPRHYVTHCQTFADNFKKQGFEADVCRFGIPDFWCPGDNKVFEQCPDMPMCRYYLYPHRPSHQKGFDKLQTLSKAFPDNTFVISTAAVFEDHIREMENLKRLGLPSNLRIVDVPKDINYHKYRRALMRNATAILSPFTTSSGYMDTGGLVSFEAIRCGCPVVVTRSPSSTEMLGSLDGKGVEFVSDGIDDIKRVLKADIERPSVDSSWMPVETFIDDYLQVMEKYK